MSTKYLTNKQRTKIKDNIVINRKSPKQNNLTLNKKYLIKIIINSTHKNCPTLDMIKIHSPIHVYNLINLSLP